jgi:hypothetical protein
VDELGGSRGRGSAKIALITQIYRKAASCGIACDAAAIDATADNSKIENQLSQPLAIPLRLFARMGQNAIRTEHHFTSK